MIAIDYDGTWSSYPELWRDFVVLCKARNIPVIVVTNRGPETPIRETLPIPVVYAAGAPKRGAAVAAGHAVTIWIDDFPHLVDLGHNHPVAIGLGLP